MGAGRRGPLSSPCLKRDAVRGQTVVICSKHGPLLCPSGSNWACSGPETLVRADKLALSSKNWHPIMAKIIERNDAPEHDPTAGRVCHMAFNRIDLYAWQAGYSTCQRGALLCRGTRSPISRVECYSPDAAQRYRI